MCVVGIGRLQLRLWHAPPLATLAEDSVGAHRDALMGVRAAEHVGCVICDHPDRVAACCAVWRTSSAAHSPRRALCPPRSLSARPRRRARPAAPRSRCSTSP
eukprot:scaffold223477_cov27-Tisochrysis_lutea.AAC.1